MMCPERRPSSSMEILERSTLTTLPRLYSQEYIDDPLIYMKLSSTDDSWNAYLAEGGEEGNEFVVFGLFIGASKSWAQLSISKLQRGISEAGLVVHLELLDQPERASVLTGFRRR